MNIYIILKLLNTKVVTNLIYQMDFIIIKFCLINVIRQNKNELQFSESVNTIVELVGKELIYKQPTRIHYMLDVLNNVLISFNWMHL